MNTMVKNILLTPMNILYKINPEFEIKLMFYLKNGYKLDLKNPVTYNAKLQWIKLYDKNPLIPQCADKYIVREYIKKCGCEQLLNDLLWQGFNPENIPFNDLPNQFVIKVTHGSGYIIICRNKQELNQKKVIHTLKKWLKQKYRPCFGEWFYGRVPPRIVIEKLLLEEGSKVPRDYKIVCFNGEPYYIMLKTQVKGKSAINIYDLEWHFLRGVQTAGLDNDEPMKKPEQLEELLKYARKLASPFKNVRVDLYLIHHKIYFGELTFTDGGGFDKITPYYFDEELGRHLRLQ